MKENHKESNSTTVNSNAETVANNTQSLSICPPAYGVNNNIAQLDENPDKQTSLASSKDISTGELPPDLSSKLQSILGYDPNQIEIIKNSKEADQLGANAFARGRSIHFAPGKFNTNSKEGKKLIAHEMAHFTQANVPATTEINGQKVNDDTALEHEADHLAQKVLNADKKKNEEKVNSPIFKEIVQRDPKDKEKPANTGIDPYAKAVLPRQKFEYNYEIKKLGNVSGSIRLAFSPDTSLVKAGVEYKGADKDKDGKNDWKIKGGANLGETKASVKQTGLKAGREISAAVGSVGIGVSPYEWLTVKVDAKALEGKMKLTEGKPVEIAALKFSANIIGKPPKDFLIKQGFDKRFVDKYSVSLSGKIEYKIPPEDLAKLARFFKAQETQLKHTKQLASKTAAKLKIQDQISDLEKKKSNLKQIADEKDKVKRRQLRKNLGKDYKSLSPEKARKEMAKLDKKIADKASQIKGLDKKILKHKEILEKSDVIASKASKRLTGKSSRFIAAAGKKMASKAAKKIVAKLIPGLNIISTAVDIIEITYLLYQVYKGEMTIGGDGGDKKGDGEKGGGNKPGGSEKNDKTQKGEGKGKAGKHPKGNSDKPYADIDLNDKELWEEVQDPYEGKAKETKLHPNAQKLYDAIKGQKGKDVQLTPEKTIEFNNSVPSDFSDAQLQELIKKIKKGKTKGKDIDYLLGSIMQKAHQVRTGESDEDKIIEVKPINYDKAGKANLSWAKRFSFSASTYGHSGVNDKAFINWVAEIQGKHGIVADGNFGPKTIVAYYESMGETESPVYVKAKSYQAKEVKKDLENKHTSTKGKPKNSPDKSVEKDGAAGSKTDKDIEKPKDAKQVNGPTEKDIHFTIRDFAIKFDKKTKIPSVDEKMISRIKTEGMHFDEQKDSALDLDISHISINITEVKSGESIQYQVSCTTKAIVTDIPSDAPDSYRYWPGDELTTSSHVLFDHTKGETKILQSAFSDSERKLLFDDSEKGKTYLRKDIQNNILEFESFDAKAHYTKKGANNYLLTLTITKVKQKDSFILLNNKKIVLSTGKKLDYNLRVDGLK